MVLLALLRLRDKAYGVSVRNLISDRTGRDVAIGAVYTTLDRLEQKGYVSSRIGSPSGVRGGRRKKFYTLEAPGERALAHSFKGLEKMAQGLEQKWKWL